MTQVLWIPTLLLPVFIFLPGIGVGRSTAKSCCVLLVPKVSTVKASGLKEERTPSSCCNLLLRSRNLMSRIKFSLFGFGAVVSRSNVTLLGARTRACSSEGVSSAMLVRAERGSLGLLLHCKFKVHLALKFTGFWGSACACLPFCSPPHPLCDL